LPWNNIASVEKILTRLGDEVAALICEPILGNFGCIYPEKGFLESLRKLTQEKDIVLIFDEVVTGFRLGLGGAQEMFGVTPDLATFAKAMANGFTIAAVAGKKEILESKSYIGGTYNSTPIATTAALATITELENKENYNHLYKISKIIFDGWRDAIEDLDIEAVVQGPGPFFTIIFTDRKEIKYPEELVAVNVHPHVRRAIVFYHELLKRGVFNFPSRAARWHICVAHSEEDANKTVEAAEAAFKEVKKIK
jgi:glutamate-1-semialdehyde 2,1-aminomutase